MSGFELKQLGGNGGEATPAGPIQSIPRQVPRGSSAPEAIELLSSRFEFLNFLSDRSDLASYLVRDLRASAGGNQDANPVVLKIVDSRACDPRRLELFRLETLAGAKLSHRNIVGSSPVEELKGLHFSIHEYRSDVETLKNLLDRHGWLDLRLALGIVHQISGALQYAHALGVLHLRIHPENLLIDTDGTALLADFGIDSGSALAWAHQERSSQCPIRFVSPEQARGESVDPRSDLYSLGVVLYQMLTDRLPLDSEDPNAVRQKQLTQTPLPPHLYFNDIPMALSETIACMLERDPAKRFSDVVSFKAALEKALDQGPGEVVQIVDSTPRIEENAKPAEVDWEDETAPNDLEALEQAIPRDKWECPTITVIDPLAAELAGESQFEETDPLARASAESPPTKFLVNAFPKNGREQAASSSRTRRVVLVLAVATAAIVALMGLAFADRSRITKGLSPEPLARKDNQAKLIPHSTTSALPIEEKASASNREPTADLTSPRNRPLMEGTTKSPSSQTHDTRRRITRPSSWRQVRRKSRRAERYEVRYRSTSRRHYRSGER